MKTISFIGGGRITHMLRGTAETLFNSGLSYSEVADLVPVKPLGNVEEVIKGYYREYLNAIYQKIKPKQEESLC